MRCAVILWTPIEGRGQCGRPCGAGGKHAIGQRDPARGRGQVDEGRHHRGDQHRRRGAFGAGRRDVVCARDVQTARHDRPGHADRRLLGGLRLPIRGPDGK